MDTEPTSDVPGGRGDAGDRTDAMAAVIDTTPIERVRLVSHLLDEAIPIPGTDYRIGLDPILGIVPVAGDSITTVVSLYIVLEAARAGAPRSMLVKMLGFVAVDAVVGSVPVVGPVFDAVWKANEWNVSLLEDHLEVESGTTPAVR